MDTPAITVAIPSLRGGKLLLACLHSLTLQNEPDFEVIVIDNSGTGAIEEELRVSNICSRIRLRVVRAAENLGFAKAVNEAWTLSKARYVATLNDDAEASPQWLASLRIHMESAPDVGMCASQVRVFGTNTLDSAGMLIFADGSSKQRGQGRAAAEFSGPGDVLCPSASAALYRRAMLDDVGMFDSDFYLYCEDTDLGLRGRRNGWRCVYVPEAIAWHHYSQSSGAASPLKAWHIERNRLWTAVKNFPPSWLWLLPFCSVLRYFWHLVFMLKGEGAAARFEGPGNPAGTLIGIVLRAHWSVISRCTELRRKRQAIQAGALLSDRQFAQLLTENRISAREIAQL